MQFIDAYNDPYACRYYARKKRISFEQWKKTDEYKSWRRIQERAQHNKCAYCKVDLTKGNIVTHIDHVTPLYHEGKNNLENLVLACRRCNTRKGTINKYVYPKWITDNKRNYRIKRMKAEQKKIFKEVMRQELDEQLLFELRQMFPEEK